MVIRYLIPLIGLVSVAASEANNPSNVRLAKFLWKSNIGVVARNRADVRAYKGAPAMTLVYENFPESCGSGGCVLDIVAQTKKGLRMIGRETLVWPPVVFVRRDVSGFPVFGIVRHGGGDMHPHCDLLYFDGKKYVSKGGRIKGDGSQCEGSKQILIKFVGFQSGGS